MPGQWQMMKSKRLAGHTCTVALMSFALRSVPVLHLIAKGHQVDSRAGRHLSDSVSEMVVVVLWGTETSGKYLSVSLVNLVKMRKYSLICCISNSFLKSVVWGQAGAHSSVLCHTSMQFDCLFSALLNGNDVKQGDSQQNQSSAGAWDEVSRRVPMLFFIRLLHLWQISASCANQAEWVYKGNLKQQFQGPLL